MNSHLVSFLWWFDDAAQVRPRARSARLGGWALTALLAHGPAIAVAAAPVAGGTDVAARVENAARHVLFELAAARGLAEPAVELRLVASAAPPPPCQGAVAVDALDTRVPARMRFAAVCPGPDGWQRDWIVRAELSAKVVVAVAEVPANQVLTAADLAVERRRVVDPADVLSAPAAAVGQASSRTLRRGDPVQPHWLLAPTLVRRGESVTILARNGAIEVQAAGEALESGRLNGVVRVRNASTGKVIRARVIEAGTVEPESIGGSSARPQSDD